MTETPRSQTPVVRGPAYPAQNTVARRGPAPPTPRGEWRCYTCGQKGHLARHCPGAEDVSMPTASPSDQRGGACLRTTCWSHERTVSPSLPVRVGRRDTHALLDSGSVVTLIRPDLACGKPGHDIEVGCIHGQTETYPTLHFTVQTPKGTFTVQAGVVPNLPMPLLIGRDCPIFERLFGAELRPPRPRHPRTRPRQLRSRPVYMAGRPPPSPTDSDEPPQRPAREVGRRPHASSTESLPPGTPGTMTASEPIPPPEESESPPLIDFSDLPLAVEGRADRGGRFATAQLEDDSLRHAWGHVQTHEGLSRDSVSCRQYPHYSTRGGLLYRVIQRGGEEVEQLIVPWTYASQVLYMAHSHLLGAHLGMDKTRDRVLGRFYWPGVKKDIEDYCRACPECQRTAPRPSVRNPLIPMPLIEVPFDRLALDIVGPLPRTSRGHRYILVMVDYATRYPEAVPLRAATAKAVARELMTLFSRVGIVREILTDQGSCFMSRVLKDLLSLLQIRHLRTSVYHPQTDGLVERFNQTLKRMVKKVMEVDGKNWDQLLPHVLFAIREVPQASTGFSPFELLYGRRPRGLLDIARDAWESQPSPHRTIIEHVEQVRDRMVQVWPVVREHLGSSSSSSQPLSASSWPNGRDPMRSSTGWTRSITGYGNRGDARPPSCTTSTC
uniref:Gypsy retrotransposon integrase-like protein 1 n=1 Tax=Gadus morhua TaxID=8049 RepID=A0A8C5CA19_GADMO